MVATSPHTAGLGLLGLLVFQLVAFKLADRNFLRLTWHKVLLWLTVRLSVNLVEVRIVGHRPLFRLPLDWLTLNLDGQVQGNIVVIRQVSMRIHHRLHWHKLGGLLREHHILTAVAILRFRL